MFHDKVHHSTGHKVLVPDRYSPEVMLDLDDRADYAIYQFNNICLTMAALITESENVLKMKRKMSVKDRLAFFYSRFGIRKGGDFKDLKEAASVLINEIRMHLYADRNINPYKPVIDELDKDTNK